MDPFSPQSYRDAYSREFTSNADDGKNYYPVYEEGHLKAEPKSRLYPWPTQAKYQAFCRSVQTYYERENELLKKQELVGVNREVPVFHGSEEKMQLVERDVSRARPDNYLTMQQWYDEAVSLSDASITLLHHAEVELVQLLLSKKASTQQINQAVENLIIQFCRCTGKRDGDWEAHLKEFMESEKVDIRIQCAKHLAPDEEKAYTVALLHSKKDASKKRVFTSPHTGDLDQHFRLMDKAIEHFKVNPTREVEFTRQDRRKARHAAAFDKVMQSQWSEGLEARDIRLARNGDVIADESVQVILGEVDGDVNYHLALAAGDLKTRKNPHIPPQIVPVQPSPPITPSPQSLESPPPLHPLATFGATAQKQGVSDDIKRSSYPVVVTPPLVLKRQSSEESRLRAFEAYGNSYYGSKLEGDPLNMDDFRRAQEAGLLNPQFVELAQGAWSFDQDIAFATFHTEILGLRQKTEKQGVTADTTRLSANTPPKFREQLVNEACHLFVGILGDRQYGLTVDDMKKAYRDKVMTDDMINACLDNMQFDNPVLNRLGQALHDKKFPYKVRTRADDPGVLQPTSGSTVDNVPDPDDLPPPVFTNLEAFQRYLRGPSPEPYDIRDEWNDPNWEMSLSSLNAGLMGLRQEDLLEQEPESVPPPIANPVATPQQPLTATAQQLAAFRQAQSFNSGIKDSDLAVAVHILNTDQRLAQGVLRPSGRQTDFLREFSGAIVVQAKKGAPTTEPAPVVQQTLTMPPPIPSRQAVILPVAPGSSEPAPMQSLRMDQVLMSLGVDDNLQVQQDFLEMKAQWDRVQPSRQQPDRVVSEKFNKHAVKASSFEVAEQNLEAQFQQLLTEMQQGMDVAAFNQIKAEMGRAHNCSKIKLEYQFGRISKDEAKRQITERSVAYERQDHLTELDRLTPYQQTLISADEEVEFELLNKVVAEMYKRQAAGNSNCQGFANSLEHFARGKGYNQVQAVSVAIELPYDNGQTSPITGWYQFDALEEKHHHHQFQNQVDAFFEAIKKGQQRQPGAHKRVLGEAFDSDRYVVLKSGTGGGAGHYTFVQRLKSSGRFIVLDAQNRQMFPILNPDGTPTDEAKAFFNNVSIQVFSPEVITDEQYDTEIKGANLCLASDRHYSHLVGVFDHLDQVPKQCQNSIEEAADWLSRSVPKAPVRAEIIKGLARAPGRALWSSLWDGTYQLKRPSEVEPLKRRFDVFDPKKGQEECRLLVKNLGLLTPGQRYSRRTALEAFQQLRGANTTIDQALKGVQETNFNAAFPTEQAWNHYCGPDVDLSRQENIGKAEQQVINAQPIRNPVAMKQLMDHLWQLSPEASGNRRLAAQELVQIRPDLNLNPVEVEADLSRCFPERGWDFLWGGLNLKRSQLISLQMRLDRAQVSRPGEMKALMDEMLKISQQAANDIELASEELAQIRPDLGLSSVEIERNLRRAFPDNDWDVENRALRGRAKEVKDDVKLNLMGRGRQVMAWGEDVQVPPVQEATVAPVEVTAQEAVHAVSEPAVVRESKRVERSQNIKEVLAHIQPGEPVVVCFDLDETLIAKDIVEGGHHERRMVNPDTAKIIQDIRTKAGPGNAKIILLTANEEDSLKEKLEKTKLDRTLFDDAITIKVQKGPWKSKGQGLHHYLDKSRHPAQHIVMVDDVQGMLDSVEKAAEQRGIPYTTFHFYGAKPMTYRVDFAANKETFMSEDGKEGPDIHFERFVELQQLSDDNGWGSDQLKAIYINESRLMRERFDGLRAISPVFEWRNYKLPRNYQPPRHLGRPVIGFE